MKQKTIPSQDLELAWLAGILDGEGSIGRYPIKTGGNIIGIVIVNTDEAILSKVEQIYKRLDICYHRYNRQMYTNRSGTYKATRPCYELTIRRRDTAEQLLPLLIPFLAGVKKTKAIDLFNWLKANPTKSGVTTKREAPEKG